MKIKELKICLSEPDDDIRVILPKHTVDIMVDGRISISCKTVRVTYKIVQDGEYKISLVELKDHA